MYVVVTSGSGKIRSEDAPAIGGPEIGAVNRWKKRQDELDFAVLVKTSDSGTKLWWLDGQQGPSMSWHPLANLTQDSEDCSTSASSSRCSEQCSHS